MKTTVLKLAGSNDFFLQESFTFCLGYDLTQTNIRSVMTITYSKISLGNDTFI